MTPAAHGVTEIESKGAGTQQTNNSLATLLFGLAWRSVKNVCSWPDGKRNMSLFLFPLFFVSVLESGFMASLPTTNLSGSNTPSLY